jgi:gliding motility-associated lipoprotein GldD
MKQLIVLISLSTLFWSCQEEVLPKPKAQLRLEYPEPVYKADTLPHFIIEKSNQAQIERISDDKINLVYPNMKAKIYLTYNPVKHNLEALLRDAEKFTYEHTVKADEIITRDFVNKKDKVFGTVNLVTGNAASQIQFHATDSIRNFLDGSLYFYAQPNYDSIMPAVKYLEKDVYKLLETLQWHEASRKTSKSL